MTNGSTNPEIDPNIPPPGNAMSVYGQTDAMDDFPVLKAFQQYIDAEQSKAQKRMTTLCIFFAIILAAVIGVFIIILMSVSQRNNALSDQVFQMMLKDRERATAPVVVQSPAAPQNDAAMKLMSDTMTLLQKQMQDQQKQMADQQLKFMEQQSKATEAAMNAAASRAVAAITPPPSSEPATPSPEQLALEEKAKKQQEKLDKATALLKAEREKMKQEKEALKQQQIELQRRRLYPDLYDENGNLIVKKPQPKPAAKTPVRYFEEDDTDFEDDPEIQELVAATRKLGEKKPAKKTTVKTTKKQDGTVRYFEDDEDEEEIEVPSQPSKRTVKPVKAEPAKKPVTVPVPKKQVATPSPVQETKVEKPVVAPQPVKVEPVKAEESKTEISGKSDGATSTWIIPLD